MRHMWLKVAVCAAGASLAVLLVGRLASADHEAAGRLPGQVIVKFRSNATPSEKAAIRQELGGKTLKRLSRIDAELLTLSGTTVGDAINRFKNHGKIEYIEPNYIVEAFEIPDDPMFVDLWAMRNTGQTGGTPGADIDADDAWNLGTGSQDIVVGVIDTGVDYNHPDLAANMWTNPGEIPGNGVDDDGNGFVDDYRGWDFQNNDNDPMDDNGHGTHCSGTIGAVGDNNIGVVGVCWTVRICPIKFLDSGGSGTTADAIACVEYATTVGVDIMSNSWGGTGYSQALREAIEDAYDAGILFVAAAGNSSTDNDVYPLYPASYDVDNVVAVAATDHNDKLASFSSYGATSVDLAAPGVRILSTLPAARYGSNSGTSMATPHVAGAAALVWSLYPAMTVDLLRSRLLTMADPVPDLAGRCVTGGRLNAFMSVAEPDSIPPAAITDLAASGPGSNTMRLSWTSTGDDGDAGSARYYQVRFSTSAISEGDFYDAARAGNEPDPQPPGSYEEMEIGGLDFSTTYYFAIKAYDEFGNAGPLSNLATGATLGPPDVAFSPASLTDSLVTGESSLQRLTLYNEAEGTLDFVIPDVRFLFGVTVPGDYMELGKDEVDPRTGDPVTEDKGGPDGFGYTWIDSDEPGGPAFNWVDITGVGSPIALSGDDMSAGPFVIGFTFPFYGAEFDRFYISTNGFISLTSMSAPFSNQPLPNPWAPENLIAAFWDDLIVPPNRIYMYNDGMRLIIQYEDVEYYRTNGRYTFEVILYPSGKMLFQYLSMDRPRNSATVGIQNATRDDGLQIAFNAPYIHDRLAVQIMKVPEWLSVSPSSGRVYAGESVDLVVSFDASGLMGGDYEAELTIESNDPDEGTCLVPVSLHATGAPDIAIGGRTAFVTTTQRYATPNASTNHLLYSSTPAHGPGSLSVEIAGDYGAPTEYATVVVEGVTLGTVGPVGWDCGTTSRDFPLGVAELEGFLADGVVDVIVRCSDEVDVFCGDDRHTVILSYSGPGDVLEFGDVYLGTSDTLRISVRNVGTDLLNVTSISTAAPEFSISASSMSVRPGASEFVDVAFTPSALGNHSAALGIESNDPDEPFISIPMSGGGVEPPVMNVSPDSLSEELIAGQVSEQHLSIMNEGGSDLTFGCFLRRVIQGEPLEIGPVSPLGEPASEDSASSHEAPAGYVPCAREPAFEMFSAGDTPDVLIVQDLMPWGSAATQVVLELNGLSYELITSFELSSKNIDPYRVVILSSDQYTNFYANVTAQRPKLEAYLNLGGVLEVHGCGWGWNYGDASWLVLPGGMRPSAHESRYNVVLEPGHPLAAGLPSSFLGNLASHGSFVNVPVDAQVITVDDAGGATLVTYRYGGGLVLASTQTLEYGFDRNQSAGRILRNMIAYAKSLASVSWLALAPTSGSVAPGDSLLVTAAFDATELDGGVYHASVVARSNDPIMPELIVPVTLTAVILPDIAVRPASIDFGSVFVGFSESVELTIENEGSDTLSVTDIVSDNPAFTVDATAFRLSPGQSRTVAVTFAPAVEGMCSGVLTVYSDDPDEAEVEVAIAGTGVIPPDIEVLPDSLLAALHPEVLRTETMTICNHGGCDLTFEIEAEMAVRAEALKDPRPAVIDAEACDAGEDDRQSLGRPRLSAKGGPDTIGRTWPDSDESGGPGTSSRTSMDGGELGGPSSWLSVSPSEGVVPPGECVDLEVAFDPRGMGESEYTAQIKVTCNDPYDPVIILPVRMILRTVEATYVELNPNTFNLGSRGKYVTCYIELPADYSPADIVVQSVRALLDPPVYPEKHSVGDHDGNGIDDLTVKLPRSEVELPPAEGDSVPVTIIGEIKDTAWFTGTDVIRLIRPHHTDMTGTLCQREEKTLAGTVTGGIELFQNMPNPAARATAIAFDLPEETKVSLKVFDPSGALIRVLVDGPMPAGRHTALWNGTNDNGRRVSPGVYFYRFEAGDYQATKKLLLLD